MRTINHCEIQKKKEFSEWLEEASKQANKQKPQAVQQFGSEVEKHNC